MSVALEIADAVVAELNGGSFSQVFTAVRRYQPKFTLEELSALRISVVPKALAVAGASRSSNQFDYTVDVGVQRKVDPEDPDTLDALLQLVEELVDYLRRRQLAGYPQAAWRSIANEPLYAPDFLVEKHVFLSVITLTYRLLR